MAGIELLDRTVAVLTAFTRPPATLSLAEIARRTGLPKTTCHRLLAALADVGLVERTADGHQLGVRLFELGQHVPRKQALRDTALPFMQDLYESSHETVHLAVLDGADVVYLERIHGHQPLKLGSRVGGRMPAYCTGLGKALLAFDAAAADRVLAAPLTPRTAHTIVSPQVLARQLAEIRDAGVAFDLEENALGIVCAAAPIRAGATVVAAVSMTGPTSRLDVNRVAVAVRTAAHGIERDLSR